MIFPTYEGDLNNFNISEKQNSYFTAKCMTEALLALNNPLQQLIIRLVGAMQTQINIKKINTFLFVFYNYMYNNLQTHNCKM